MRARASRWWGLGLGLALTLSLSLSACASTPTTAGTGTPTSNPAATAGPGTPVVTEPTATTAAGAPTPPPAAPAPPHAFAWYQIDSHSVPQIWASLNGGVPQQITHVPPDGSECDDQIAWAPPVFSPDLTHIVSSLGSFNCGDGDMTGTPSVITVSSGAVSNLPNSYIVGVAGVRTMGWLDNSTIWFVTYDGIYKDSISNLASPVELDAIPAINDAVYRGGTLFLQTDSTGLPDNWVIEEYNVGDNMIEGMSINQGQTGECQCSPGDAHGPGWDISPDGFHIIYQYVTPSNSTPKGIASSKIYYSGTDNSGKTQIAHALTANQTILMQFSWDGQWAAFTEALPSPDTLTASVNNPGNAGDPSIHAYTPDSFGFPVWKWDNSQFWAASVAADNNTGSVSPALYNYARGGSSHVGVAGGFNPWYTIGS